MPEVGESKKPEAGQDDLPENVRVESRLAGLSEDDLALLAQKVYDLLRRELVIERERQALGLRR